MSTSEDANQNKKDYKVRTSITIDPEVLDEARSVSSFIEEALKKKLSPL
jgi:hypothetical protein